MVIALFLQEHRQAAGGILFDNDYPLPQMHIWNESISLKENAIIVFGLNQNLIKIWLHDSIL